MIKEIFVINYLYYNIQHLFFQKKIVYYLFYYSILLENTLITITANIV